jgi:D-alanyl-D-alanine carboxypeptidase
MRRAAPLALIFSIIIPSVRGEPMLLAEAAISVDLGTGEIIFAKSIDRRMYPASITKLVTAIVLAERKDPADSLFYSEFAKSTPPHSLDLLVGDRIAAAHAMDALLLYSANDIAAAIAENLAGDVESFGVLMNQEAAKIGMRNTRFSNPSGLHSIDHFTTTFDLSKLAAVLFSYPWIMASISRPQALIETEMGVSRSVANRNKLVGINGCIGGKTGYTSEAGRCLLALYERDGRRLAAVIMKSVLDPEDTAAFSDMESLINYSYNAERVPLFDQESLRVETVLSYRAFYFFGPTRELKLPVGIPDEILLFSNGEGYSTEYTIGDINPWKLDSRTPVGTLTVSQRDWETTRPLYPLLDRRELLRRNLLLYFATLAGLAVFILIVVISITGILFRSIRVRS